MTDMLDNPVWFALTGAHASCAIGAGLARHYPRSAAPFSAFVDPSPRAYAELAVDLPPGVEARLFRPAAETPPPGWIAVSARPIRQMVADCLPARHPMEDSLVALGPGDVPAMLALADIAKPGPFGSASPMLGRFLGHVDARGRLLAMAGERFLLPGHVELSAVCVHPEARSRGIGAALTLRLAREAIARGTQPFLHVFPENPAAELYERLGFRERRMLWVLWHRPAP